MEEGEGLYQFIRVFYCENVHSGKLDIYTPEVSGNKCNRVNIIDKVPKCYRAGALTISPMASTKLFVTISICINSIPSYLAKMYYILVRVSTLTTRSSFKGYVMNY